MHSFVRSAALASVLLACSAPPDDVESALSAHAEGEIHHRKASPFHWARVDEAADAPKTTPASDPLQVRLQAWADRIDTLVVASAREQNISHLAPRPIVHVVPTTEFNAWATGALVSLGASFDDTIGTTFLSPIGLGPADLTNVQLIARPSTWPSNRSFLDAWSATNPTCGITEAGPNQMCIRDSPNSLPRPEQARARDAQRPSSR